jgi:hypothetical protein
MKLLIIRDYLLNVLKKAVINDVRFNADSIFTKNRHFWNKIKFIVIL